jgi:hypothetical protein
MSERRIARFAGIVTTAQLRAAGVSGDQIRRMARQGTLVPVCRGAYAQAAVAAKVAGNPAREHALRVASVLAVAGPGDVGSHHSAAIIHGLDQLGRQQPGVVSVTRPPGGSQKGRSGVRLHIAELPGGHVTAVGGVRVTSVARTVVDLARTSPFRSGVVVADSALRAKQTTKAELEAVIADCTRWPGLRRAGEVVKFSDGKSESVLESISRVAFREQGIPPPDLQELVGGDDGWLGRADFLWRRYGTIGEADGAMKYASPAKAVAQLRRDRELRAAGFEVVHFTWDEIMRTPGQVAADLRAAFRRGAGARSA